MTNWSEFQDCYGSAADFPDLLAKLTPDPDCPAWSELWGRVYHQGNVYPASYAVLPYLLEKAAQWPAASRSEPLILAGVIVTPNYVPPECAGMLDAKRDTLRALHALALETIQTDEFYRLEREERVYVLAATLALGGNTLWGYKLGVAFGILSGDFFANCPSCGGNLYIVIGEYGFFCSLGEWVKRPQSPRMPIVPAQADELAGVGAWLFEQSLLAKDNELGKQICHLFGETTCPKCHQALRVADLATA